ncbi:MarR family winged helix-turn-helix transcriptional regulator [Notoacmeibacter ruber]|nr:MarR family transcriptional regulator [Notoacmeibacter ruber]
MVGPDQHSYEGCVRAYTGLADAADAVTRHLQEALAQGPGLSIVEFDALLTIGNDLAGRIGLSEVSRNVRLSQSALSRLVDRLVRRGLLRRVAFGSDRRSVGIEITAMGRALLNEAVPVHAECIRASLLDRLTVEERTALKSILLKIAPKSQEQDRWIPIPETTQD